MWFATIATPTLLTCWARLRIAERFAASCIRGVGDELAQEDLLVEVQR